MHVRRSASPCRQSAPPAASAATCWWLSLPKPGDPTLEPAPVIRRPSPVAKSGVCRETPLGRPRKTACREFIRSYVSTDAASCPRLRLRHLGGGAKLSAPLPVVELAETRCLSLKPAPDCSRSGQLLPVYRQQLSGTATIAAGSAAWGSPAQPGAARSRSLGQSSRSPKQQSGSEQPGSEQPQPEAAAWVRAAWVRAAAAPPP